MFNLNDSIKVYAFCHAVDMRKSYPGLLGLIKEYFNDDSISGNLFVFVNKRHTLIKILYWDRTGYCILSKRMESGKFSIPRGETEKEISQEQLKLMLDGIKLSL